MSAITRHEMPNEATVADWLGTAALAARMASNHLEAIRTDRAADEMHTLSLARQELKQALSEIDEVAGELAAIGQTVS